MDSVLHLFQSVQEDPCTGIQKSKLVVFTQVQFITYLAI
jgi:hypothetical protein